MPPAAFYALENDRVLPTAATIGPWDPGAQHAGPPSALLLRAVEAASAIEGGQTVRFTVDILRPVPVAPLTITTAIERPGRRVELVVAELRHDGVVVMRARAWRMHREAPVGTTPDDSPPPPPENCEERGRPSFWAGEFVYWDALEWRWASGDIETPGPACVWTRPRVTLVEGEPITPLQHLVAMTDAASGVASVLDWSDYSFVNVDLSLALERPPAGEWVAMDAATRLGEGAGVASASLWDARGRVGSSSAALLIARNA